MTLIEFLIFVAIGCGIGFLAGLFGVGGGILIVPILIFSYEHSGVSPSVLTHIAFGTSLFVVIFASLTSAYQHGKQGNIDWRSVFVIGFSSALTALATTRLAAVLSGKYLQAAFALIVLTAAIRMLIEGEVQAQKKLELSSRPHMGRLIGIGLATGVVSGLVGIGGGVFIIPMMYYFLNMPLRSAIGTSSATVVITALFSMAGYILGGMGCAGLPEWSFGFVDLQRGIALAIGSLFLARFGAYISYKIHPYHLRRLFALFIILISIYMLVK